MAKCLGIGIGPANLSLACHLADEGIESKFFDRCAQFRWHEGMQIQGASLQVSLFKDLVTLANPTSRYSFLAYLHQDGRLGHFINAQFDAVSRREFANYLAWVCEQIDGLSFGTEVEEIDHDGSFVVRTNQGEYRAPNVVLGVGKVPSLPDFVGKASGEEVFHSAEFMWRGRHLGRRAVAVVGGGQSGAEVFLDLISRNGADRPSHVSWISSRTNFLPMDDSPFTNDLFLPCYVEHFAALSRMEREQHVRDNILASDGISAETLRAIYQRLYTCRFVDGEDGGVSLLPGRQVISCSANGRGSMLMTQHKGDGGREMLYADAVIFATGYRNSQAPLSDALRGRLEWEGEEIRVGSDYSAYWDGPEGQGLFVQNATRNQKGLADPNLSLMAWRSRIIADAVSGRPQRSTKTRSFVSWRRIEQQDQWLESA